MTENKSNLSEGKSGVDGTRSTSGVLYHQQKKSWENYFKGVMQVCLRVIIGILCIALCWVIFTILFTRTPDVVHNSLTVVKVQLNDEGSEGLQCTYFFAQKKEKGYKIKFTVTSVCGLYQVNDKILLAKGK